MRFFTQLIPGFLVTSLLAVLAYLISNYVSLSANLIAIILGFVLTNILGRNSKQLTPGIRWCEVHTLAVAVAFLGAQLDLAALLAVDSDSLWLVIAGLLVTFVVTFLLAKLLRVSSKEACLLASGQGICGSAAVMASQSIVKAPATQAGLVVALVNFLGFAGVFVTVWLASEFFQDDGHAAGILVGNTLQSMGHVVAAGFSINDETGQMAVLIKMCRILLLIPVLLMLIFFSGKQAGKNQEPGSQIHWLSLIPTFIWVFLLLSFLASMGWLPADVTMLVAAISKWLFLLAMAAIGLNIKVQYIHRSGGRILVLGLLVFFTQLMFSVWILAYC
ncbi:MAG: putative sulfate exporter family transporter [Marinicella sp.]